MKIWRIRIAGWIPKATNTHSKYVNIIAFPLKEWLHEHSQINRQNHTACQYIYRHNSVNVKTMLQAGQPCGCRSTFAGTTEVLTRQNPDSLWDPHCYINYAYRRRYGNILRRTGSKSERPLL